MIVELLDGPLDGQALPLPATCPHCGRSLVGADLHPLYLPWQGREVVYLLHDDGHASFLRLGPDIEDGGGRLWY